MASLIIRFRCCCPILSCFYVIYLFTISNISRAQDTLRAGDGLIGSDSFLESSNKYFRLRFFPRSGSANSWYLGIQCVFMHPPYTLWVASPNVFMSTIQPKLTMDPHGRLLLWEVVGDNPLTVNAEQPAMIENTTATLLDSANLVLRAPGGRIVWQSFDYPSNTWLPGMKLGLFGLKTGQSGPSQRFLTSWVSDDNPAFGAFTFGLDLKNQTNNHELVFMRRGIPYWRSDEWDGKIFSDIGTLALADKFDVHLSYFSSENETYFSWNFTHGKYTVFRLESTGIINLIPMNYSGEFGYMAACDVNEGDILGYYGIDRGCTTPEPSHCGGRDKFNKTSGTIDKWDYLSNSSLSIGDCKYICRNRCSCDGYAAGYADGTGCKFAISGKYGYTFEDKGETIYLRLDKAPRKLSRRWKLVAGVTVPLFMVLILIYLFRHKISRIRGVKRPELSEKGDDELPFFSLSSIKIATDDFSDANKLGQGGFGPVYKGKLFNGQKIAVKRLSKISGHGIEQFKNEVILISKLQHRNLVRLLGYCTQGDERLLVYEYLPNKSLDSILFDATRQTLLDWKTRINIIEGIAQGLLYLHKYSRLRIIHRDLKTSNILLDTDMNPKISDFGTARIFQDNDTGVNTKRIMGTHGYMSPEYAMAGLFSEKSDVFSFGVVVLEIISGKKITSFYHPDHDLNLLGYAWDLWKEEKVSDFADPSIAETFCLSSGSKYVQVALLCVQENAADRPTMLDVVSMIINESTALPVPKQPAFSTFVSLHSDDRCENPQPCSINKVTISDMEGR